MKRFQKGFTLIELLVATSLFVIITTSLITALSIFLLYNLSLQDEQQALHSLGFAADTITREARLGVDFSCSAKANNKCIGLKVLAPRFDATSGALGSTYDQFCYRYKKQRIERSVRSNVSPNQSCDNPKNGPYIPITNPELNITDAFFIIKGGEGSSSQPNVELHLTAEYSINYLTSSSPQTIETVIGVTQRILELPDDTGGYTVNILATAFSSFIYNGDGNCVSELGDVVWSSGETTVNPCDTAIVAISDIAAGKRGLYILGSNGRAFFLSNSNINNVINSSVRNAANPRNITTVQPVRIFGTGGTNGRGGVNDPKAIARIHTDQRFDLVILEGADSSLYSVENERGTEKADHMEGGSGNLNPFPLNNFAIVANNKLVATKGNDLFEVTKNTRGVWERGSATLNSKLDTGIVPEDISSIATFQSGASYSQSSPKILFSLGDGSYVGYKSHNCFTDSSNVDILFTKQKDINNLLQIIPFGNGKLLSEFDRDNQTYNKFNLDCSESTSDHLDSTQSRELSEIASYSAVDLDFPKSTSVNVSNHLWVINDDNELYGISTEGSTNRFNKNYEFGFTSTDSITRVAPLGGGRNQIAVFANQKLYLFSRNVSADFTAQTLPSPPPEVTYIISSTNSRNARFIFDYIELKDTAP